jgi:hypothetical protein
MRDWDIFLSHHRLRFSVPCPHKLVRCCFKHSFIVVSALKPISRLWPPTCCFMFPALGSRNWWRCGNNCKMLVERTGHLEAIDRRQKTFPAVDNIVWLSKWSMKINRLWTVQWRIFQTYDPANHFHIQTSYSRFLTVLLYEHLGCRILLLLVTTACTVRYLFNIWQFLHSKCDWHQKQ